MSISESQRTRSAAVAVDTGPIAAAIVRSPGDVPHLGRVTLPRRAPGETLLTVLAAPLNPLDLLIASGTFHSVRHDGPYVPGSECVGVVKESDRFAVGSVVYAECHASPASPGALAEEVLVHDTDAVPIPAGVDPIDAAAVGNSGVAGYLPLIEIAHLSPGETVLILGATGAVGQLAVQIARRAGAGRVIGVGRDPAGLRRVLALGADETIDLRAGESVEALAQRFRSSTDHVDVVLDGLYGAPLEAALTVCAPRARVVNIGNLAGPSAEVPAGLLRGKQLSVTGFAGLHLPLDAKRDALEWLWGELSRGDITIETRTVPLDELPTAWHAQATSPHAKYVICPDSRATGCTRSESS